MRPQQDRSSSARLAIGAAALVGLLTACPDDGSDVVVVPLADVSGTWIGTWASFSGTTAGTLTITAVQADAPEAVTGTASLTGSPCFMDPEVFDFAATKMVRSCRAPSTSLGRG